VVWRFWCRRNSMSPCGRWLRGERCHRCAAQPGCRAAFGSGRGSALPAVSRGSPASSFWRGDLRARQASVCALSCWISGTTPLTGSVPASA
jgi:hypothetical protein